MRPFDPDVEPLRHEFSGGGGVGRRCPSAEGSRRPINDNVLLLLRLCGDQGDLIRAKSRREKAMKSALPPSPGRAYTADEKARMLTEAAKLGSKNMYPALVVDLNCGLRDKELRELRWRQIDLVHKK